MLMSSISTFLLVIFLGGGSVGAIPETGQGQATLKELRKAIKSKDDDRCYPAMHQLSQRGDEGAAVLLTALEDKRYPVRIRALELLGGMGTESGDTLKVLLEKIGTHENSGYASLARVESMVAAEALILAVTDRLAISEKNKKKGKLSQAQRKAEKELHKARYKHALWRCLRQIGSHCLEDFLDAVATAKGPAANPGRHYSKLRIWFGLAVKDAGPDALPLLEDALEDTNRSVQAAGLLGIGLLGEEASATAARLVPFIESDDMALRGRAVEVLGMIGADIEEYDSILTGLLSDSEGYVRLQAARSILTISGDRPAASAVLIDCTGDRDTYVRAGALLTLAYLENFPGEAGPAAFKCLRDRKAFVRKLAIKAVMRASPRPKGLIARIKRLSKDKDKQVRRAAESALRKLGVRKN